MTNRPAAALGTPVAFVALVSLAASLVAAGSPEERFFRENHWTGAFYLGLLGSGHYSLLAQEHVAIFPFDEGTWTREGGVLVFRPTEEAKASFRGRLQVFEGHTFIVWLDEHGPGRPRAAAEVEEQIRRSGPAAVGLVYFEISRDTYDAELRCRYPFQFYPEMNRGRCGEESDAPH